MKLTAKLAYSQLTTNKGRTAWTLVGIMLSTAMITAVFGFAASGDVMLRTQIGGNEYYSNFYTQTLIGMAVIFTSIIVAASVIVVSNAFRISAGERMAQFGILKSVGATKKQIAESVVYEGFFLCAIGVPLGIILGLLVNLAGIGIANYFLTALNNLNEDRLVLDFVLAWQAVSLSIAVAFMTVMLSAWLPARKAAKTPAIDAIRGAGEVKVKAKHVRSNRFVGKLFGFEGTLASKSLKRSKRNFRATVVSLTVSIVLLIVVSDFGAQMNTMTTIFFPGTEANISVEFFSSDHRTTDNDGNIIERRFTTIDSELASDIAAEMRTFGGVNIFGVGVDTSFGASIPLDMLSPRLRENITSLGLDYNTWEWERTPITIVAIDAENYAALCRVAGVPLGSNILVNQVRWWHESGGWEVFTPYVFTGQTLRVASYFDDTEFDLTLHGVISETDIPGELDRVAGNTAIIVPRIDAVQYNWYANADDASGFANFADAILREMLVFDESLGRVSVFNAEEAANAARDTARLVMTFIYGFVGMLTLIGLTNVISTISTNVRSRSREFAVLRSVGMTDGGLKRMLNLESILCSMKSLIIGVPLGIACSYLVYNALEMPVEFSYAIPWTPIIGCVGGVFVITWATMQYSAARLRGGSVVDTIRKEVV